MIRYLSPLLAYFILTIGMTWPTTRYFTAGIPGDGFDGWQNYWNLWWVKQALLIEQTTPYFTDYLYPPTGVSLLFHTLNIFNGLWTLPLQLNFGVTVAYNSVVLFSFVMAGFGGYLLSLHSLNLIEPQWSPHLKRGAAFIGGLVYTMSPFHFAHLLGHMQVFAMIWPPFYILWLLRTLRPWRTTAPPISWRDVILCALFLALTTLVALYHTLYLLIFTALTLLWTWWQRRRSLRQQPRVTLLNPLLMVGGIGLIFGLLMSPLLVPMVLNAAQRPDLDTGLAQNIALSADLLAFVTPSEMHPLWGEWAKTIANNFSSTTSERLVFAGFLPLLLGSFAIIRLWSQPLINYWTLMLISYTILALGPYLHLNGRMVESIPLPYYFLYHTIPFINLTRSLSRYDLIIMLVLGVLVSIGVAQLLHQRRGQFGLMALCAGVICLEFLAAPYPMTMVDTPQFFYDIATDQADYTIAELPMNWDRPTPLLHQTTHAKRLLTAYTSRNNPLELAWRTPVFQQWRYLGADIIDQPLAEIAPTIFYDFNLRYVVLDYWQMPPGPERDSTEQWVSAALPNQPPVYDDGRLIVYQTPPKEMTRPYLSLGDGWGERQLDGATVSRAIATFAEIFLHHAEATTLLIEIASPHGEQTVVVWLDGQPLTELTVTATSQQYAIPLAPLTSELAKIELHPTTAPLIVHRLGVE